MISLVFFSQSEIIIYHPWKKKREMKKKASKPTILTRINLPKP